MTEKERTVDFITSLALAVVDTDKEVRHIQITICQDVDTKKFECYFDVVDPSKVGAVKKDE